MNLKIVLIVWLQKGAMKEAAMKKISFLLSVLAVVGAVGCQRHKIVFDESEPLALIPDVQWALVKEPYSSFRESPTWESHGNSHCRKGDILCIIGKLENEEGIWYKFQDGYLPQEVLEVYSNRYKALSAEKELK